MRGRRGKEDERRFKAQEWLENEKGTGIKGKISKDKKRDSTGGKDWRARDNQTKKKARRRGTKKKETRVWFLCDVADNIVLWPEVRENRQQRLPN